MSMEPDSHADATAYLLAQLLEWQVNPANSRASARTMPEPPADPSAN